MSGFIAEALSATHIIEGSVRKAGKRVRITVQLTRADNGLQLWSENYDHELTDVFAIQEDIARAIATSFNMQLGLRPGENLVNNRNIHPETYQLFLRARTAFRGRGTGVTAPVAIPDLVKRDPQFAPGWGLLAQLNITLQPLDTPLMARAAAESRPLIQARVTEGEKAAREAIRLDPQLQDSANSIPSCQNSFLLGPAMKIDPVVLVTSQLDAYNARDLDRFLKCYSEDAVIEDGTGQVLMKGRDAMGAFYGQIFRQSPELHCEIKSRMRVGSYVVDEETITGLRFAGFPSELHSAVVYRVDGDHIVHVRLLM